MRKCSVDLITGFLGSGKTTFINHILNDYKKEEVLITQCEKGIEELRCGKMTYNINSKHFSSNEEISEEELIRSLKFYAPKRLIIECNGVSETKKLIDNIRKGKLKEYVKLGLIVNLLDITTLNMFLKNIPSMIIPNLSLSNLIVLNKCEKVSNETLNEYVEMIGKFNSNAHIVNCIGKEEENLKFNKERLIKRIMG
ncbi:GTP-binding protein [Clostridium sp.]|uniref:GTP-binding protein n=1 Tax=Clostridium sp. TaxID=1506 RepID=UPI00262535DD|nr:GTP-binding protein [Clostridium sp.]